MFNSVKELEFYLREGGYFDCHRGIRHKSYKPAVENDLVRTYIEIECDLLNNIVELHSTEERVANLKILDKDSYGYPCTNSSSLIFKGSIDELKQTEYYDEIIKNYAPEHWRKRLAKRFKEFNEQIYTDDSPKKIVIEINPYKYPTGTFWFEFDKYTNRFTIGNNNGSVDSIKFIDDVFFVGKTDYNRLQTSNKIIELLDQGKEVRKVQNGYIVDNIYFENLEDAALAHRE